MPDVRRAGRGRKAPRTTQRAPKYVYAFGAGRAEGSSAMRDLLGGKGCELAEMTNLGVPVPPGFTITTEAWAAYDRRRAQAAAGGLAPGGAGPAAARAGRQARVRRPGATAARLGALGRAASHAGHDGHRPQPGPERPHRRGARPPDAERALRLGLLPALRRALRRRRARHRAPGVRRAARRRQGADGRQDRRRGAGGRPARADRGDEASRGGADGPSLPPGPGGAAPAGRRRRVRLVVRQEGDGLPADPPPARRLGHRGDRHGDGVRQPRRHLGHRRVLHARPLQRRAPLLRRVPA